MSKKGMIFDRIWLPIELKIHLKKLEGDKWLLSYRELLPEDMPPEDMKFTLDVAKKLGVDVKRRGNAVSYKIVGPREAVFSVILGESLAVSGFGDMTLRELFALAAIGLPALLKAQAHYGDNTQ